jgi:hypothetical protein
MLGNSIKSRQGETQEAPADANREDAVGVKRLGAAHALTWAATGDQFSIGLPEEAVNGHGLAEASS